MPCLALKCYVLQERTRSGFFLKLCTILKIALRVTLLKIVLYLMSYVNKSFFPEDAFHMLRCGYTNPKELNKEKRRDFNIFNPLQKKEGIGHLLK